MADGIGEEMIMPGAGFKNVAPLVRLENVCRTFFMGEVEVKVIRGVDLEIYAGELLIIHGESGSGKSTLLNMIGGIDRPSSGIIFFNGNELTAYSEKELTEFRRNQVGFIFQFYNLIPSLTAVENVRVATEIATNPMDEAEALELVGLGDRLDYFPSQLSGGQQQRVAIARALAKRPRLMLCDEPTGALDHETTEKILQLLHRINKETETTMVMITHSSALLAVSDRSVTLSDGKISGGRHRRAG
ncbi:ABC transporter ATP-binding protein [Desulforhopalus singaporensis]|uniref:Putative ABC transport system ATP-binding protein n=1 Tax=Desulforhopalus singaporensis TaxID=91360 RepID=A0A1H0LE60_9BACT|nr:ABC transporter ATP-binding protein [Desulforhopalus singaporensis]SDO66271.1 putative ABC transport system ATP-binding protein [Desulforhopalus singaporensis]